MPCPHCGREEDAATPPCPHCPRAPHGPHDEDANTPVPTTHGPQAAPGAAVIPEVLPPDATGDAGGSDHTGGTGPMNTGQQAARGTFTTQHGFEQTFTQGASQDGSFRFTMWQAAGPGGAGFGMGAARNSCLPGAITLFLTLVCAVQFGVLAALGFVIFHLVGSGAILAANLQQIMRGRPPYLGLSPWLGRIAVWGASWALAGWLSGGF